MSIFKDPTGQRARMVKLLLLAAATASLATAGLFLASLRGEAPLPPLGAHAPPAPRPSPSPREEQAREKAWQREAADLRKLLRSAQRAQERRTASATGAPVLGAFVVNWDPASLRSLALHKDQLTHLMPEWIRAGPGGELALEEDARVLPLAAHLELMPMVTNYGEGGFQRALAVPLIETARARADAARRLRELCQERGWAGLNLDLEALEPRDHAHYAAFVEALWAELHPRGFLLSVDVPAEPGTLPAARLAAASDFLIVMAYDLHASTDEPGPISTPPWVSKWSAEWLRLVPADKLVVALGAYGYDWPLDADGDAAGPAQELSFDQALVLARENEVPVEWDARAWSPFFEYDDEAGGQKHRVWFLDAPAAAAQLDALAPLKLRGTALWRLGAEDPTLFALYTRPPAPRAYDAQAARLALQGEIPHDPADVSLMGAGELIRVKATPHAGRREVAWDASGKLLRVDYRDTPSGYVLERRGGRPAGKIALTFDDGPDPTWTPRVLDALKAAGVRATFFVIGENAQARPELVRRALAEGHLIGNHTFTHPDLSQASPLRERLELNATARLLEWISGAHPVLFRPPYHSDQSLDEPAVAQAIARASALGYWTLGHDLDPEDFAQKDGREIARRVLERAKDGTVVLLHDGGGDRSATVAAIPLIAAGLRQQGIALVSVDELLSLSREDLLPQAPQALLLGGDGVVFSMAWALRGAAVAGFAVALALLALRGVLLAVFAPWQWLRARRAARASGPAPHGLTVSVVVPAYNEEKVIARTVQSLLQQEPPVLEVVCVDDGSNDRTLQVLREQFAGEPRVRVLAKPNGGKSSALNLGFAEARGELVVALDSDTLFAADTVAQLCAPFADARVAAVAGNAKVGNRVNRLTRWQALEYVTAQNLERRAWDLIAAVPVVPGAVGAWRRAAVAQAGGFHEDTLAEDTDLTLRLLALGHRVVYAERALAFTEAPETARALLKQRFRWTYGVLQACWKHKGRLFRRGAGALGWLVLPAFAVYLLVASLARGQAVPTLGYYLLFFALDLLLSGVAIALEGEALGLLWGLFVQRIAYRQLLWVALVKSLWAALVGFAVGWGKLSRTGSVGPAPQPRGPH
jgi:cellulose synthase/poly-beta-1,6-N-acetylglucosamine synthase-like glycosyltransferase/peptidoglycan/xylan/chitin deacetylase (PgdA/CDA1 family)